VAKKKSRLYRIWSGMKQRCNNPNSSRYQHYGAKGIKVCEEWAKSYKAFADWSYSHGYTDNPESHNDSAFIRANSLSIDRIDPDKDYCPQNCRWIPAGLNTSLSQAKKYGRSESWCFEHWNDHHHMKK
jgi:hypothetical protein